MRISPRTVRPEPVEVRSGLRQAQPERRVGATWRRLNGMGLFIALAACMAWGTAGAADQPAAAPSPYKLVLPAVEGSRLTAGEQYRLPAPPRPANPALAAKPFSKEIDSAARSVNLDPALLHAVIHVESRHQAQALSPKGAMGLMQVMPDTGARFGVPRPDKSVEANLKAGSLYLRTLMQQFDGRLDLVLAAYNAGEGAVVKYANAIPPYAETRAYVPAVMAKYEEWRQDLSVVRQIEYLPGTRLTPGTW